MTEYNEICSSLFEAHKFMINMDILLCESVVKNNILNLLSDALQYFCVIIVDMKYVSSISDVHVLYVANYCFMFCSKLITSEGCLQFQNNCIDAVKGWINFHQFSYKTN